jgi:acyl-coenzyme A thioesterase PaaI-like protein
MNIQKLVSRAQSSGFYKALLNFGLARMIPFNAPHGFKVTDIGSNHIQVALPYKKRNFNHIRGLHACAMATVSEFTTGFLLVSKLDPKKYRLIMQRLEMDYHYQGKMNASASFRADDNWLSDEIYTPLKNAVSVVVICEVKIHDVQGNHLSTGKVHWQIKSWDQVKTKVNA